MIFSRPSTKEVKWVRRRAGASWLCSSPRLRLPGVRRLRRSDRLACSSKSSGLQRRQPTNERLPTARVFDRARSGSIFLSSEPVTPRPTLEATLQLNLFDDASYRAVLDRIDPTQRGFVWVGHVAGVEMSTVSLATEDGVMSGYDSNP